MNVAIINCFDVYEQRVELLKQALEEDGHSVRAIISNFRHIQKCTRLSCPDGFEQISVRPYYATFSPSRIWSHWQFARRAFARAEQLAPDLLWVLAPPDLLVKYAADHKRRHPETRIVLDMMDLWPESMPIAGFSATLLGKAWCRMRDDSLWAADAVVAENSRCMEVLRGRVDGEKACILLDAPRDYELRWPKVEPPCDKIALCLAGQLNGDIDISAISALIRGIDAPVELHAIGQGDRAAQLEQAAEEAGAQVTLYGVIHAGHKKQEIFDRCHFGLNLLVGDLGAGMSLKGMDYLRSGLPIINNARGDTWQFVEKYPVGINYVTGDRLAAGKLLALQSRREQIPFLFDRYFARQAFREKVWAIARG